MHDLRASIETIDDEQQRPVYAAPSLMSVRSCFVVPSNGQSQLPYHYAQSQPQLSHSFSQPFISRMSNSADHLVTSSLSQLHHGKASELESSESTLPFHEHVKNVHKFQQKSVTVSNDTDVNVIGTAVRIQVGFRFADFDELCIT